jgi:hypothetical protein
VVARRQISRRGTISGDHEPPRLIGPDLIDSDLIDSVLIGSGRRPGPASPG